MKAIRNFCMKLFNIVYYIFFQYTKYVLVAVVLITCAQVVLRVFFRSSIRWGQEVPLVLIVWLTFLAMTIGIEKDLHINVGMFYNWFPKPVQKVCDIVRDIITLAIGIFFGIYGTIMVQSTTRSTMPATKWPAWVLYIMIPVGGWCMFLFKLFDIFGWKKYKKTNLNEDVPGESGETVSVSQDGKDTQVEMISAGDKNSREGEN